MQQRHCFRGSVKYFRLKEGKRPKKQAIKKRDQRQQIITYLRGDKFSAVEEAPLCHSHGTPRPELRCASLWQRPIVKSSNTPQQRRSRATYVLRMCGRYVANAQASKGRIQGHLTLTLKASTRSMLHEIGRHKTPHPFGGRLRPVPLEHMTGGSFRKSAQGGGGDGIFVDDLQRYGRFWLVSLTVPSRAENRSLMFAFTSLVPDT